MAAAPQEFEITISSARAEKQKRAQEFKILTRNLNPNDAICLSSVLDNCIQKAYSDQTLKIEFIRLTQRRSTRDIIWMTIFTIGRKKLGKLAVYCGSKRRKALIEGRFKENDPNGEHITGYTFEKLNSIIDSSSEWRSPLGDLVDAINCENYALENGELVRRVEYKIPPISRPCKCNDTQSNVEELQHQKLFDLNILNLLREDFKNQAACRKSKFRGKIKDGDPIEFLYNNYKNQIESGALYAGSLRQVDKLLYDSVSRELRAKKKKIGDVLIQKGEILERRRLLLRYLLKTKNLAKINRYLKSIEER